MPKEITSVDIARLASEVKDLRRTMEKMVDGLMAANTNLVAIHTAMKEKTPDE